MKRIDRKSILKRVKEAAPVETKNITIKVPETILTKFEKICETEGISRNAVLVELLRKFVGGE